MHVLKLIRAYPAHEKIDQKTRYRLEELHIQIVEATTFFKSRCEAKSPTKKTRCGKLLGDVRQCSKTCLSSERTLCPPSSQLQATVP